MTGYIQGLLNDHQSRVNMTANAAPESVRQN
jgi:hypothetical protein